MQDFLHLWASLDRCVSTPPWGLAEEHDLEVREAAKLGFRQALAPRDADAGALKLAGVSRLADAISRIGDGGWSTLP